MIIQLIFNYVHKKARSCPTGYAKITSQIYQKRESSDSPGSFGFKRARKVDFRTLSEIY